jgi:hypothetical protein
MAHRGQYEPVSGGVVTVAIIVSAKNGQRLAQADSRPGISAEEKVCCLRAEQTALVPSRGVRGRREHVAVYAVS